MAKSSYYEPGKGFFTNSAPVVTPTPTVAPVQRTATPTPQVRQPVVNKPIAVQPKIAPPRTTPVQNTPMPVTQPKVNLPQIPQKKATYMSGGFLDKAFDVLRTPEYAIASMQKGGWNARREMVSQGKKYTLKDMPGVIKKSLSEVPRGISQRTSWGQGEGDVNVLGNVADFTKKGTKVNNIASNKTAQNVSNFGLQLAAPTIPVAKVAKIPGIKQALSFVGNVGNKINTAVRSTPKLAKAIEKVVPYYRNPAVGKMIQETSDATRNRVSSLYRTVKQASDGLTPEQQAKIGQILEGAQINDPKLQALAAPIRKLIDDVGQEAVNNKLMKPETYAKFKGQYMTHIFNEAQKGTDDITRTLRDVPKSNSPFFKKRTGKEGYIQEFAPAVFKGLGSEMRAIEAKKLLTDIAGKFGVKMKDAKQILPQGMVKATDGITDIKTKRLFQGVALPEEVVDYINRSQKVPKRNIGDKALDVWKQIKTIYNPGYHVRNVLSNQILADMQTGKGLLRTGKDYAKSVYNYSGKGDQRFAKAAENANLIRNPNVYESTEEFMQKAGFGQKKNIIQKAIDIPRKVQSFTEDTAKLNVFKTVIQKEAEKAKMTVDEAMKNAGLVKRAVQKSEEAIFSPYRISQAERNMVSRVIPFYSFTRQALPFTLKTLANNPSRLAKYPRAIDQAEGMASSEGGSKRGERPDNVKGSVRLPIKDDQGRETFFDPTYILPYGNFQNTGLEKGQLPFGLSLNPFAMEAGAQLFNKDPYFGKPVADSTIPSRNLKQRGEHLLRSMSPTAVNAVKDKLIPAFQGKEDYAGNTRGRGQAVVDFMGLRTKSYDSAQLRSKAGKKDNARIYEIQQEAQKVSGDQSMSEEERTKYLQELRNEYWKLVNPE